MKLTTRGRYAVTAMLDLAINGEVEHGGDGVSPACRQFHEADCPIPDYFSQE